MARGIFRKARSFIPLYRRSIRLPQDAAIDTEVTTNAPDALILTEYQATIANDVNVTTGTPDALILTEYQATVANDVDVTTGTPDALVLTEYQATVANDVDVTTGTPDALILTEYQATITYDAFVVVAEATLVLASDEPIATTTENHFAFPAAEELTIASDAPTLFRFMARAPPKGTVALAGKAPSVERDYFIDITTATLAISKEAVEANVVDPVGAITVPYVALRLYSRRGLTLDGHTPSVIQNLIELPGIDDLVLAGQAPSSLQNFIRTSDVGDLALTGYAPELLDANAATPGIDDLILAGQVPTVFREDTISIPASSIGLEGQVPTVSVAEFEAVPAGNINVTGYAPTAVVSLSAAPAVGSLTLSGQAVALQKSYSLTPAADALVLTGQAPILGIDRQEAVAAAALAFAGVAPTLDLGISGAGTGLYLASPTKVAVEVMDDFNRADGPLGNDWLDIPNSFYRPGTIKDNQLYQPADFDSSYLGVLYATPISSPNHFVEFDISDGFDIVNDQVSFPWIILRAERTADPISGIKCFFIYYYVDHSTNTTWMQIYYWDEGNDYNILATDSVTNLGTKSGPGYDRLIFGAEALDDKITGYMIQGGKRVDIVSAIDSRFASNTLVGMGDDSWTDFDTPGTNHATFFDNFRAGAIEGPDAYVGTPYPVDATTLTLLGWNFNQGLTIDSYESAHKELVRLTTVRDALKLFK